MNILYIFQLPTSSKLLMDSMILMVHRIYLNYATPYEVFKELTGIDAIILVKGIRL